MVILRKPRARKSGAGLIICGVQHTGSQDGNNGWALRQVTASSPLQAATLNTAYFDEHPLFQFPDWTDASGNVFCEIPIAYWWRGNLPDTTDGTTPRWTMLMSTQPGTVTISGTECEFTAAPGAFKRAGAWMDKFYFGKYRGCNVGNNKVGSKSGQTHWVQIAWTYFKNYCANNGANYHMITIHEWQEICARAVIEKSTFQLISEANRQNAALCKYRGIEEFAYHGTARTEFLDGIRIDATGKYEIWNEAGGNYENTGVTAPNRPSETLGYSQTLLSGDNFDFLFLGASLDASSTCCMPDFSGRISNSTSRICTAEFSGTYALGGAFNATFYLSSANTDVTAGTRLCKW